MSSVLLAELQQLVSAHGYWVVALIVGLESMGLPLPDPGGLHHTYANLVFGKRQVRCNGDCIG